MLKRLFGAIDVEVEEHRLIVDGTVYPIVDDVVVLLPPEKFSSRLGRLQVTGRQAPERFGTPFARDIQLTFGAEWTEFDRVLPEHASTFRRYFDLVELDSLRDARVCDLGCGNGRWSYFLKDTCKELILVDFSDAIFVARRNLAGADNCLFFQCDLTELPFAPDFADFTFCLGVLHHLPTPCLDEVRRLRRFSPIILVYLYYALDNRPWHFRALLKTVTALRLRLSGIRSQKTRRRVARTIATVVYRPLIVLGRLLAPLNLAHVVPLYETYHDRSTEAVMQDVYDRFFTRIEQRVTRQEVLELRDTFDSVVVSDRMPFWHFVCRR